MSIDLSNLSAMELYKLYNVVGWELFLKTAFPFTIFILCMFALLWIVDKRK